MPSDNSPSGPAAVTAKNRARQTGVRGETYAYASLRRHGYVLVARNLTSPGSKGEIDRVGTDGSTLAFVAVKTGTIDEPASAFPAVRPAPKKAVDFKQALRPFAHGRPVSPRPPQRKGCLPLRRSGYRIRSGNKSVVRPHKSAFNAGHQ